MVRHGHDDTQRHRQRYRYRYRYVMGLNVSNCQIAKDQIAKELGLNEDDAHAMATHLREGRVANFPEADPLISRFCCW